MNLRLHTCLYALRKTLRQGMSRPAILAFMPAMVLGGFWLGGEEMLIMTALGFPICLAFAGMLEGDLPTSDRDPGPEDRTGFETAVQRAVATAARTTRKTGCIMLELDDPDDALARYGRDAFDSMTGQVAERLRAVTRPRDVVCRLEDNLFAISIAPVRQLDLGIALHMASRVQAAVEDPFAVDGATVYLSASVGLALSTNIARKSGPDMIEAAMLALSEARRHGPSAMRAFSQEMRAPTGAPSILSDDAVAALENGQIQPWYQPQISTDTGRVTGFEALARWSHPRRGMIAPAEFLPVLEQASRMERLSEVMLYNALSALKSWDAAGLDVPRVGVNFSPEELRNPRLVDKIKWELDRFDLPAHRLNVEILETVVATSPDDTVVRNISGLSAMGCQIDLDDFGTGHASISSIRRFDVQRLKIDRSFVMKVDRDPEQQRMVSAILLMAERLGLDTLAEGVETAGEHAMLAQLGCGHVQGFGIGRPMPLDQTVAWTTAHLSKLHDPPAIGRQTG